MARRYYCDRCGDEVDWIEVPRRPISRKGHTVITIPLANMEVACDSCYNELLEVIRKWKERK
jgi:hypothetical protein